MVVKEALFNGLQTFKYVVYELQTVKYHFITYVWNKGKSLFLQVSVLLTKFKISHKKEEKSK